MKSQETKVPVGGFTGRYCNASRWWLQWANLSSTRLFINPM